MSPDHLATSTIRTNVPATATRFHAYFIALPWVTFALRRSLHPRLNSSRRHAVTKKHPVHCFFVQMHCIMDENKTIDYKRTFPQINGQSIELPISRLFGGLFHTQSQTKGGHYKKHFFLKNDLKRRKMVLLSTQLI